MTKDLMLRHWTNTLVNRDFPRTVGWDVSNLLISLVNSVPRESGSGVRVCKACGDRMSLSEVARFCRLFIVKLFLDSASLVSPYERFPGGRGTVEELDRLGLLSDSWEPIVPDTEKALSMGIDFHKMSNYCGYAECLSCNDFWVSHESTGHLQEVMIDVGVLK